MALVARSKEKLQKVAEKLGKDNTLAIECDVSKPEVRTYACFYTQGHIRYVSCMIRMLETLFRMPLSAVLGCGARILGVCEQVWSPRRGVCKRRH